VKTHLGHYEIVEELGRGGMGVVYKGFEPALSRYVAIKELSPSLAHDANLVERFLREARSMAVLNDPHIIQIYFIGTDQATGQPFFAMEFVDGDSLSGLLKRDGRLSVENALKVLHQTAQGLATAHDKGVIHRDIKPGNLMVTERGNVKIADFGIALATQDFSKKLTSTGEFVGTPGYLSPEVCTGKTVDRRSDIFSLGIVLYEMLTGASPFTDESPLGLMLEVVKAEIPDIRAINAEVDVETAAILTRMLAKDPADRFQSCHDLAAALQQHPLVAKGGTIRLAIAKPAPTDATVIGAPTPGPLRAATPPPVVGRTPAPAAAADAATLASSPGTPQLAAAAEPAPRAAVQNSPKRPNAALPIAIAAVLLLAIGAAIAFGGADFISGFKKGYSDAGKRAAVATVDVADRQATAALPIAPVEPVATGATDAAPMADVAAVTMIATVDSGTSPAAGDPALPDAGSVAAAASGGAVASAAALAVEPVAVAAAVELPAAAASATIAEGPGDAAADSRDRPLAKALRASRETVASTAPARQPDAAPPTPRVAVVALGDPALTAPVRQLLEQRLARSGFDLVESSLFVSDRDDLARALAALRREATVAIVVSTESLGTRQLQFYGRSETQYSARLSVRAYLVGERRPLGPGFAEQVEFTGLNAKDQAEAAIDGKLERVLGELSPYRRRG
jgi:eukaryotic-like serine/threonine-protein kinase